MVNLNFLGGTHEVGRNAVLLESNESKILLDYGVKIGEPPDFPSHVRARDLDGIIVSHAHLDHSGGVPIFYLSETKPFFATPLTSEVMRILIRDMIKLSGYYLPFEFLEFFTMMKYRKDLGYMKKVKLRDIDFSFLNAGHIPGSAMIELRANGKRILYTGDVNTADTRLVHGAKIPRPKFDAVIIESTYAKTDHSERKAIEEAFITAIKAVLNNEGKVLVPAFAVGRSQEMLSVIHLNKINTNIVVDGMARSVNQLYVDYPQFLRMPKTFMKIVNETKEIRGWRDRRQATKKAEVIVAPSGMLQGGTAMFYLKRIAQEENNGVFLVSYQVPGTGGAKLLETGFIPVDDREVKVNAQVRHFDFSSHCGKSQLEAFLKGLKGNPDIYVIHGEPENCDALSQWVRDELGLKSHAPNEGDEFQV